MSSLDGKRDRAYIRGMKSKAHGSIQEIMRANLNRLMAQAKYNPKSLSEAAELNRGYVTGILTGGRGIGPEVMMALADPLSRALGRDGRTIVLEMMGYNVGDMKGGRATPIDDAIAEAKAADVIEADPVPVAPVVAEVKVKPAKKAKPAPEVVPPVEAVAVPLGFKVWTWAGVLNGKAAVFVVMTDSMNKAVQLGGMGKSKFYRIATESTEARDIKAAVERPGELLAYLIDKPGQIKDMAAWA